MRIDRKIAAIYAASTKLKRDALSKSPLEAD